MHYLYNHNYKYIFIYFRFSDVLGPVGFSAYSTENTYLDPGEVAHFDALISNIGGHFNPSTSSFVCPYHGVYLFSINFNSEDSNDLQLAIVIDSEVKVQAYADYNDDLTTGSALVIVECGPSQVAWVKCNGNGGNLRGDSSRKTHFAGYLLHAY